MIYCRRSPSQEEYKAEQKKRPKFPCDPTGLFVAEKHQAVQSSENTTT